VHYTVEEARMIPDCVQRPRVPLAIAAGARKTLAVVARHADAWITYGDPSSHTRTAAETERIVREQTSIHADHHPRRGDPVWNDDPAIIDEIAAEIASVLS
jgi:alkanesulfonate monooxygenase SsuD/methylene tetrahydromethanopterin reductase-like flavin-dependent oxidoreductase (luciferase family)